MKKFKNYLKYLILLKFIPHLSQFIFDSETFLRIKPLKAFLNLVDPQKSKKMIDLGGANGRLETALGRKNITLYDINEDMLDAAEESSFSVIRGRSGKSIDCEDNSFDWAISVHTLEHVDKQERERFIFEMIRISKEGIYLNFPAGLYAEKLCMNYIETLKKYNKELNHWTLDHIEKGLPDENELRKILSKQSKFTYELVAVRNYKSENYYWQKIIAPNSFIIFYILSPINSIVKYLNFKTTPSVELVLIASKSAELNQKILKNI